MRNLTYLVETHSEELYDHWLKEVLQHPDTHSYHNYPNLQIYGHVRNMFAQLDKMINCSRDEVEKTYMMLGADRFQRGFELSEVLKALILARRVLWSFIENHGFYNALELRQAMDFRYRILRFFDRTIFFTTKGFEREALIHQKLLTHIES